jgi:hypothetical protein
MENASERSCRVPSLVLVPLDQPGEMLLCLMT